MSGNDSASSNRKLKYPFAITPVDSEINDEMSRDFAGILDRFVLVGPKKYCYTGGYRDNAERLYNFQAQPDDIWVVTFPRSGTTLTQELVWLIANDFDFERAQQQLLRDRFSFLESFIREGTDADIDKGQSKPQRFIKTHFSFSLLPPSIMDVKAKTIYVARHPKDVVVSMYHLFKLYTYLDYKNDFAKFWDYFERDLVIRAPYFEHIKEGWAHRDEPNVLFLFYDELINDLPATIKKIATFLGKEVNDDQMTKLLEHLQFDNFRQNPAVNCQNEADNGIMNTKESSYVRRGKISGKEWQPEFTPEIIARVEKWLEKNLRDTTLRFPEY